MTKPTTILIDDADTELEAMAKSCALRTFWTAEQEALLEKYYGKVPTKALAKKLGKSTAAVYKKVENLGLSFTR